MSMGENFMQKGKESLIQDFHLEWGSHDPTKYANPSAPLHTYSSPDVDLHWMICPVITDIKQIDNSYMENEMFLPGFILWSHSLFSTTEVSMSLKLNRTFICPHNIIKAIPCLVQYLSCPLQSFHLIHCSEQTYLFIYLFILIPYLFI